MNWDRIKGYWKQVLDRAKFQCGRVTNDEIMQIGGQKDELVGKVQERYGQRKEQAEKQISKFINKM